MSLIKVAWYVTRVKNMHLGSPSDPSQTAASETKLRYVYLILKPYGQSFRWQVRLLLREAKPNYVYSQVLRVSVGHQAAKLQAVKVGVLKKNLPLGPPQTARARPGFESQTIGSSSNFDSLYLCSQLTYRDPQYLFGKI